MIRITRDTWVLVADGEKALILENLGSAAEPRLAVKGKETQDNPPDREQASDRPGRMNDGPSAQRSALDETDWHELGKARFAADLAEWLYARAHRDAFDHLVLVADPSVLGELRAKLHEQVKSRIIGEIPKVLTNHPTAEIARLVQAELNR